MLEVLQHNFFTEAEAAGDGRALENFLCDDLTIAVSGTFTGLAAKVYGKLGEDWYELGLLNCTSLEVTDTIEDVGMFKVGAVSGCEEVKVTISAITSGKVTIIGRLLG